MCATKRSRSQQLEDAVILPSQPPHTSTSPLSRVQSTPHSGVWYDSLSPMSMLASQLFIFGEYTSQEWSGDTLVVEHTSTSPVCSAD